ncbi:MAG: hypothetical protein AAF333_03495 [Planctomycetota bacterium]
MKLRYKIAFGGFVCLMVFHAAVAWLIQWSGQRALEREIEQVIAAGGARDFSAFDELDIPDDENAALAWLEVFRELDKFDTPASGMTNEEVYDAWSDYEIDGLGSAMEARRAVFEQAHAAAQLEQVRWPYDYAYLDEFFNTGYFGKSRKFARFLVIDATAALSKEDWERADKSLVAALSLSEDIVAVPLLINTLVSVSIDMLVIESLEGIEPVGWGHLPNTVGALTDRDYRDWFRKALLGEVAYGLSYDWDADGATSEGLLRVPARLWRNHDLAFYTMRLREMSALVRRPYYELEPELRAIEAYDYPRVYPISASYLESSSACVLTLGRMELRRDLMIWAAALAGTESISHTPIDALTGQPLKRWRSPGGGWVLWSIEAEKPESAIAVRDLSVWLTQPGTLPPELQPYAYELNDEKD